MEGLSKPEAVIFDWDGTLVDTLPGLLRAHNHVRTLYDLPVWTEPQFMENIKYSSRELYPKIYGDNAARALEQLYEFVLAHHLEELVILDQAPELIRFLHGQGIPVGIVSNKRQQVLVREVEHLGWSDLFFCVFGSGAAARDKPAGDPVILALQKATRPLTAARTWFVGDTVTDLLAAAAAGCPAVLLTHGQDRSALIDAYKPFLVAGSCGDFLRILRKIFEPHIEIRAC